MLQLWEIIVMTEVMAYLVSEEVIIRGLKEKTA